MRNKSLDGGHSVRRILRITCAVALIIFVATLIHATAAVVVREGDRGDNVIRIQKKLIQYGYLKGTADGVFGTKTKTAVISFQKKNGLSADGKVGPGTAAALGITLGGTSTNVNPSRGSSSGDVYLLARLVHGEARGESYKGKVAVAAVVLNRVKHPSFPNTIAGVIYQPGAFTAVSDGQINLTPNDESLRAARDAMNGYDPTNNCIYYYNPAKAKGSWIFTRDVRLTIGKHRFAV